MRRLLAGTAAVLFLIVLGTAPAAARHPFSGAPVVYVGLEDEFAPEEGLVGMTPVGLRSIRLGEPSRSARVLTDDPRDSDPAVSPDGRWIAFSRAGELLLMRVDGSRMRRLTDGGPAGSSDIEPSFAPGGRRVLFVRLGAEDVAGASNGDVYSVGIDGIGLQRITFGRSADRSPVASPNGRQVVFAREPFIRGGGGPEWGFSHIYSVRPDGSRLRDLTPRIRGRTPRIERKFNATDPAFNPNGRVVAFTATGDGSVENVYTMRPDGSRLRNLTGAGERPLSRNSNLSQPAFSPSGRSLLVTARKRHPTAATALAAIDLADRSRLFGVGGVPGESAAFLPRPRR